MDSLCLECLSKYHSTHFLINFICVLMFKIRGYKCFSTFWGKYVDWQVKIYISQFINYMKFILFKVIVAKCVSMIGMYIPYIKIKSILTKDRMLSHFSNF